MSDPLTLYYASNPWESVTATQRDYYEPALLAKWKKKAYYNGFVPFLVDMNANKVGNKMIFSGVYEAPVDLSVLPAHTLWKDRIQVNSYQLEITAERYGGVISIHEDDIPISYWSEGLIPLCKGALGDSMMGTLDLHMRNAFLSNSNFTRYAGSNTAILDVDSSDTFDKDVPGNIWIAMAERGVELAVGTEAKWSGMMGLISPRQFFDLRRAAGNSWIDTVKYSIPEQIMNFEMGMYEGIRYQKLMPNTLKCRGLIEQQTTLNGAAYSGEGAAATVYGVYKPKTKTGHTKAYVTVTSASGFSVGDDIIITAADVAQPLYSTTTFEERKIIAIDGANISLDKPLDWDWDTASYFTKAAHAQAGIFIGGNQGVVGAVYDRPKVMAPPPVDDFLSMHRFSWKAFLKFQLFFPEQFEVYITGGSTT